MKKIVYTLKMSTPCPNESKVSDERKQLDSKIDVTSTHNRLQQFVALKLLLKAHHNDVIIDLCQ